nr:hypothetical protein PF009_g31049 [Phytophthora fragariae]
MMDVATCPVASALRSVDLVVPPVDYVPLGFRIAFTLQPADLAVPPVNYVPLGLPVAFALLLDVFALLPVSFALLPIYLAVPRVDYVPLSLRVAFALLPADLAVPPVDCVLLGLHVVFALLLAHRNPMNISDILLLFAATPIFFTTLKDLDTSKTQTRDANPVCKCSCTIYADLCHCQPTVYKLRKHECNYTSTTGLQYAPSTSHICGTIACRSVG